MMPTYAFLQIKANGKQGTLTVTRLNVKQEAACSSGYGAELKFGGSSLIRLSWCCFSVDPSSTPRSCL